MTDSDLAEQKLPTLIDDNAILSIWSEL